MARVGDIPVAERRNNSFDRVFPKSDLFRDPARTVVLWSSLGSLLFIGILFDLFLIVDLLATQGTLTLRVDQLPQLSAVTGEAQDDLRPAEEAFVVVLEDRGILPAVWQAAQGTSITVVPDAPDSKEEEAATKGDTDEEQDGGTDTNSSDEDEEENADTDAEDEADEKTEVAEADDASDDTTSDDTTTDEDDVAGAPTPSSDDKPKPIVVQIGAGTPRVWSAPLLAAYRRIPALRSNASALSVLTIIAVLLAAACHLLWARGRALAMRTALGVATRLRQTIHRQTLRLGPADLEGDAPNRAFELFTTEVDTVHNGIAAYVERWGRFPFEIALLTGLALAIDWRLTLQIIVPLCACWYLIIREQRRSQSEQKLIDDRTRTELRLLAESLRKTRLVRGYDMSALEQEHFQTHLQRFRDNTIARSRGQSWSRWVCLLVVMVSGAIVLYLVGTKVVLAPEHVQLSPALFLIATLACLVRPLNHLWQVFDVRAATSGAADRIYRYLNQIPEVGQAVGAKFLQPLQQAIQFESVSYRISSKRKLLDGLDLKLPAGRVTALVSLDQMEALAMAYLLPRFIEPQSGRVLFDGEDIDWVTLESLRAECIFVGGADPLFTGTIRENICCGSDGYSLQDVTDAAKLVHAHNFIVRLAQGYETFVGDHGESLEPGAAFRIGLARAALRNPALMIVEEPLAVLDDDTKSLIDDAYQRLRADRTVIFLPSRLSTVRRADQVILLHRGRVEASGTHAELLQQSALYRHWEYVRFNEFRHELEVSTGQ